MNRIIEVLEEKRLTQIWLAEKLNKSYNIVNSYAKIEEIWGLKLFTGLKKS